MATSHNRSYPICHAQVFRCIAWQLRQKRRQISQLRIPSDLQESEDILQVQGDGRRQILFAQRRQPLVSLLFEASFPNPAKFKIEVR